MNYRDLYGKGIGLVAPSKICSDFKDFFCELDFIISVESKELTSEIVDKLNECDCIIIGYENKNIHEVFKTLKTLHVDSVVYTLSDVYAMVDELETFYIDKRFYDKTICLYGNKDKLLSVINNNPHLKVDYIIADERLADYSDSGYTSIPIISINEINNLSNVFVIIANDVSQVEKDIFINLGLKFGSEFHFYNSRVPKHPTSYYLRKTLLDLPKFTIPCDYTKRALSIKQRGNVMACCSSVSLVLGSSLHTSIEEILNGIQVQLIRLSINNRTYSFCGDMCFMYREEKYRLDNDKAIANNQRKHISLRKIRDFNVQLGYDRSCNLACPSCRTHRIIKPEDEIEKVEMMHEEVKRMCHQKPRNIRVGNGELFFSPYYRDIIFSEYENDNIALISNGMLFTPENWSFLENRYKKVSLEVSIDAVDPATYKKLRGGDLYKLRKNMDFASKLRRMGKLKNLSISFVIQVENFREMVGFVEYGKSINADLVHFTKLNSWGHIPEETFIKMDVYDERNEHHKEFVEILQNPIFGSPLVHVDNINNYIKSKGCVCENLQGIEL